VNELVIGLMACFGLVVVAAVAMILMHRRHLREWRRKQSWAVSGKVGGAVRRTALVVPLPRRWVAIRSGNTSHVMGSLGRPAFSVPWSEALARVGERRLFVSSPVSGWTFVVGDALPDPVQDVDRLYRFLSGTSREVGEVQFFSIDRVLGHHAWARLRDGRVQRGYAWSGAVEWNEGPLTLDERLLKLRCHDYGESPPQASLGEATAEMENAERVPLLARRWGMDLAAATEVLLHAEGVEMEGGDGLV
jgi:hypothetical protein